MNTLAKDTKTTKTIVHSNPILSRVSKLNVRTTTNAATYAGIAAKTTYFLLITLVGMLIQLVLKAAMAGEPVWQTFEVYEKFTVSLTMKEAAAVGVVLVVGLISELVGIFAQGTIPVTGTLYAASQGYVISFIVFKVLVGYEYLGLEALLLTIAVVLAMSWLYSSGIVKAGKKFRAVLLTLVLGSVGLGVLSGIGMLIPVTRPFVTSMLQNSALTITLDVIGLITASLFLISDFSMIDDCVRQGYPKSYEWAAAFGLVFTVIWIYLKILDLLMQFAGKDKD